MFENVAIAEPLSAVRRHVFDPFDDPIGADRIDAIAALDKLIRSAQAEQAHQIAALSAERSNMRTLTSMGASLSVIGELGLARNISPSAAGTQYGFAVGLARLPGVHAVFARGQISEQAARRVVDETTGLDAAQAREFDRQIAAGLAGLTPAEPARRPGRWRSRSIPTRQPNAAGATARTRSCRFSLTPMACPSYRSAAGPRKCWLAICR